jgi:hypothetical protein
MTGVAPEDVEPDRAHITHSFGGLRHATKITQGDSSGFDALAASTTGW